MALAREVWAAATKLERERCALAAEWAYEFWFAGEEVAFRATKAVAEYIRSAEGT